MDHLIALLDHLQMNCRERQKLNNKYQEKHDGEYLESQYLNIIEFEKEVVGISSKGNSKNDSLRTKKGRSNEDAYETFKQNVYNHGDHKQ